MLGIYDEEKRSAVAILENAAGFTRARHFMVQSRNKMAALGYVYTSGRQASCFPKRCTSWNDMGANYLEVQILPRVLVYDWDL